MLSDFLMQDNVTKNEFVEIFFFGPAGRIHGKYYKNTTDQYAPIALMLHPDPAQGGTMNNKIISDASKIFVDAGFTVLKINYRGVGKTEGVFSEEDQINDTSVILDWLQMNNPNASHFWVLGYSIGSWIAANLTMRRPEIENFIFISPLVNDYDFLFLSPCPASGLIVFGDLDDKVPDKEVSYIANFMNNQNSNVVECKKITGANHIYKSKNTELNGIISEYINTRLATRVNKPVRKKRRRRKKKDSL